MSMTLEQAFDALNDTTMRLQNVAVECSNDDMADAMREKARVHARAVATVKAHLAQPAQSVDVDAIKQVILQLQAYHNLHGKFPEAFPDMELDEEADKLIRAIGNTSTTK